MRSCFIRIANNQHLYFKLQLRLGRLCFGGVLALTVLGL